MDAVLFDWGGTLTPWHTIELADAWRACGLDRDAASRLVAAEETVWARARDTHRSGTIDEVFAAAGVTAGPAELAAYYAWWEEHTLTDPDVRPLFEGLRERGIRIGVLSNTLWPRTEHERVFRRDGGARPHRRRRLHQRDRVDQAASGGVPRGAGRGVGRAGAGRLRRRPAGGTTSPARRGSGCGPCWSRTASSPTTRPGPYGGEPDAVVHRLADVLELVDRWR